MSPTRCTIQRTACAFEKFAGAADGQRQVHEVPPRVRSVRGVEGLSLFDVVVVPPERHAEFFESPDLVRPRRGDGELAGRQRGAVTADEDPGEGRLGLLVQACLPRLPPPRKAATPCDRSVILPVTPFRPNQ